MKKPEDYQQWAEEFKNFMSVEEVNPPQPLSNSVLEYVHKDLNPRLSHILAKLASIHVLVGSLSLLVCSQFGMGHGYSLVHVFMQWGELVCMMTCGAFFLGLTTVIGGMILTRAELRRIRRTGYSVVALLAGASLLVFFCFGAEIALNYALAWLVGALAAGILGTELCLGIRRYRVV